VEVEGAGLALDAEIALFVTENIRSLQALPMCTSIPSDLENVYVCVVERERGGEGGIKLIKKLVQTDKTNTSNLACWKKNRQKNASLPSSYPSSQ
jgi:hypothetical protein